MRSRHLMMSRRLHGGRPGWPGSFSWMRSLSTSSRISLGTSPTSFARNSSYFGRPMRGGIHRFLFGLPGLRRDQFGFLRLPFDAFLRLLTATRASHPFRPSDHAPIHSSTDVPILPLGVPRLRGRFNLGSRASLLKNLWGKKRSCRVYATSPWIGSPKSE